MRIPGLKTARLITRRLRDRLLGGGCILGYHRVAHVDRIEPDISVTPDHFSEQMEVLRKHYCPLPLSEFVRRMHAGSLPEKAVAVTFDDGYAEVALNAGPALERASIPAAVFVCTGWLGREFWWDELERLVTAAPAGAGDLRLVSSGALFAWGREDTRAKQAAARARLLKGLHRRLLGLDEVERAAAIEVIRGWVGAPVEGGAAHRALLPEEILHMDASGHFEIGSHSATHPALDRLDHRRQRDEISGSKAFLEELLGRPVRGFAYPNGAAGRDTQALVAAAGYSYACSSRQELARQNTQPYSLPRFWPRDWDGDRFARCLRGWMGC